MSNTPSPYAPPPGGGFQQPPHQPVANVRPQVITWQKVYLGFMIFLYIAIMIVGVVLFFNADAIASDPNGDSTPGEMRVVGVVYGAMGFLLSIVFAAGFFVRKGTAGWIYNLVMIAIGCTSCCFWPATIPLMIYWIKQRDAIQQFS